MTSLRTAFDNVARASMKLLDAAQARDLARRASGKPGVDLFRLCARRLEGTARATVGSLLRTRPRAGLAPGDSAKAKGSNQTAAKAEGGEL